MKEFTPKTGVRFSFQLAYVAAVIVSPYTLCDLHTVCVQICVPLHWSH